MNYLKMNLDDLSKIILSLPILDKARAYYDRKVIETMCYSIALAFDESDMEQYIDKINASKKRIVESLDDRDSDLKDWEKAIALRIGEMAFSHNASISVVLKEYDRAISVIVKHLHESYIVLRRGYITVLSAIEDDLGLESKYKDSVVEESLRATLN